MGRSADPDTSPTLPEAKSRRCVQSKLSWGLPKPGGRGRGSVGGAGDLVAATTAEGIIEDKPRESEEKGKKRARRCPRKLQAGKKPPMDEETAALDPIIKDEVSFVDESPHKKQRKGRNQAMTLKVRTRRCCKALESVDGHGSHEHLHKSPPICGKTDSMIMPSDARQVNGKVGSVNDRDKCEMLFDLRSEAKIAAKENLKLSSGKKTHPFFASRMADKGAGQDVIYVDDRHSLYKFQKDVSCCPPIHVLDQVEANMSIHWSEWAISEGSFLDIDVSNPLKGAVSVLEGLAGPLKIEDYCKGMHLNQLSDLAVAEPTTTAMGFPEICDEQNGTTFAPLDVICIGGESFLSSNSSDRASVFQNEQHNGIVNGSYQRECYLWTDKYQPENASQVCGNIGSVKLLSEWLKCWDERGRRSNRIRESATGIADGEINDGLYEVEADMDDSEGASVYKNVLLITGPVGCGKSAAVYACAKEQGFNVVEVNSSDMRSGAYVRQKFEEATKSHGLEKWSKEEVISPPSDNFLINSDQDKTPIKHYWGAMGSHQTPKQVINKTLILFDDVDIVFDEDRGFISTILQLAETTKWPIILTTNKKNPVLPHLLNQLVLDFKYPSSAELLSHVDMICKTERADISVPLMKHVINTCLRDIRRTTMLLQFWCQGNRKYSDRKDKCLYSRLTFDLEAVHATMPKMLPWAFDLEAIHATMPKMLPWDFPCNLSAKICEEIGQTICLAKKNKRQMERPCFEGLSSKAMVGSLTKERKTDKIRKTKNSKFKSVSPDDCKGISPCGNDLDDFNDAPEIHLPSDQRRIKNRRGVVLSSESDDDLDDKCTPTDAVIAGPVNGFFPNFSAIADLQKRETPSYFPLPSDSVDAFGIVNTVPNFCDGDMTVCPSRICDTFMSQDMSYVPESSFVAESVSIRNDDFPSMVVSSNDFSAFHADGIQSICNMTVEGTNSIENIIAESRKYMEAVVGDTCDTDGESVRRNEQASCSTSGYALMDECSRAESIWLLSGKQSKCFSKVGCVQDTWNKLRSHRHEMFCAAKDHRAAFGALKLASGMADLMSESDLMFTRCNPLTDDTLDPSSTPSVEPDVFSWYGEQLEMGSVYAQHALCLYGKKCESKCTEMGESYVDLAQELLCASTTVVSLGKLFNLGVGLKDASENSLHMKNPTSCVSKRRERQFHLYDILLPVIPAKISLSLRGPAFMDYLSSISQISRLERSRLSESKVTEGRRRSRQSRHYLTSGSFLSPEDVELLAESSSFHYGLDKVNRPSN